MSLLRTVAIGFVCVALFGASRAHAQSSRKMSLVLGEPPALEVELQYHDPSDLFTRLAGARVVPLWVVAKNISVKNFVLDEVTKNRLTLQTPLIQDLGFADQARGPAPVSKGEFVFVVGS